jgi:hypothetical protein
LPNHPSHEIGEGEKKKKQKEKKKEFSKVKKPGVCHTVALPFTLKSILRRQKKNYGNSIIFHHAKI